jgi:hypothetical protein
VRLPRRRLHLLWAGRGKATCEAVPANQAGSKLNRQLFSGTLLDKSEVGIRSSHAKEES